MSYTLKKCVVCGRHLKTVKPRGPLGLMTCQRAHCQREAMKES
jgi:hypothetical protein